MQCEMLLMLKKTGRLQQVSMFEQSHYYLKEESREILISLFGCHLLPCQTDKIKNINVRTVLFNLQV